jgi:hypothetical protein
LTTKSLSEFRECIANNFWLRFEASADCRPEKVQNKKEFNGVVSKTGLEPENAAIGTGKAAFRVKKDGSINFLYYVNPSLSSE